MGFYLATGLPYPQKKEIQRRFSQTLETIVHNLETIVYNLETIVHNLETIVHNLVKL